MSLSSKRGIPLAVFDGRLVTEKRTAAVSAAVTKYLAPDDNRVLTRSGAVFKRTLTWRLFGAYAVSKR